MQQGTTSRCVTTGDVSILWRCIRVCVGRVGVCQNITSAAGFSPSLKNAQRLMYAMPQLRHSHYNLMRHAWCLCGCLVLLSCVLGMLQLVATKSMAWMSVDVTQQLTV